MTAHIRCFHVPLCQFSSDRVNISGRELHHLMDVVRLRAGDSITILDGVGGIYEVVLLTCSRKVAIGEIKTRRQIPPPLVKVTLLVGLPKADRMDMVIQKTTELGVYQIVPVLCEHTVPHLLPEREMRRVDRWRQLSIEASKQSRRPFFPIISAPLNFDEALRQSPGGLKLIFVPYDLPDNNRERSTSLLRNVMKQNADARDISIFIGPEGGFTEDEVNRSISAGIVPVSLGSNILRTETAAIAALAVVLYKKGVME